MKYYAYKVAEDGGEPVGSEGRLLFELKTDRGAIRRCHRIFVMVLDGDCLLTMIFMTKTRSGQYIDINYSKFYILPLQRPGQVDMITVVVGRKK